MQSTQTVAALPPGQRRIHGFPRFGTHLSRPAPAVPANPAIEIHGAVLEAFDVPLGTLTTLSRRELIADLHCVAGWSATNLLWEGVSFATFYNSIVAPALPPGTVVTHVSLHGLDGERSVVTIEDALADDVIIADHLHGLPLDGDHGAPARFVSPSQYGYMSVKHLCRIGIHTARPRDADGPPIIGALFRSHPRARVWNEERNGSLPSWLVRPLYRALKAPLLYVCARGGERLARHKTRNTSYSTPSSASRPRATNVE